VLDSLYIDDGRLYIITHPMKQKVIFNFGFSLSLSLQNILLLFRHVAFKLAVMFSHLKKSDYT